MIHFEKGVWACLIYLVTLLRSCDIHRVVQVASRDLKSYVCFSLLRLSRNEFSRYYVMTDVDSHREAAIDSVKPTAKHR